MFDDSDGDLGESADYAGEILAEAILSADLDEKERKSLERKLAPIAKNLSDYGIENGVEIAQLALEYGWETHPEYVNDFTADLDSAKLNVLEHQGRIDEFLALCQQTGQHLRYIQKLMQLGAPRNPSALLINFLIPITSSKSPKPCVKVIACLMLSAWLNME